MRRYIALMLTMLIGGIIVIPSSAQESAVPIITAENAHRLEQLAILGRGTARDIDWRPDGEVLAVGSATGLWLYDENLNQLAHLFEQISAFDRVRWSRDGTAVAALCGHTLYVLHVSSDGTEGQYLWNSQQIEVSSVSWHPNGQYLVTAGTDRIVRTWDAATGVVIREIPRAGDDAVWSPEGTRLAVADDAVRILDATTYEVLQEIGEKKAEGPIHWNPDGSMLATSCFDEETFYDFYGTCVWIADTGQFVSSLELMRLVWSPDGQWQAYFGSSPYGDAAGTGIEIRRQGFENVLKTGYYEHVFPLIWHPQTNYVTGLADNGHIIELDASTGELLADRDLHSVSIGAMSFSPNGSKIAATRAGMVYVWNLDDLKDGFLAQPEMVFDTDLGTYTFPRVKVTWISGEEFVTVQEVTDFGVRVSHRIYRRNANTGEILETILFSEGDISSSPLTACGFYPNSDLSMMACPISSGLLICTIDGQNSLLTIPAENVFGVQWSPDDSIVAFLRVSPQDTPSVVEFHDAVTGALLYSYETYGHYDLPSWSPHSDHIAAHIVVKEGGTTIHILDATTYETIATVEQGKVFAWSSDGSLLAIATNGAISFWDAATNQMLGSREFEGIDVLAWSADGTVLATANRDGTARLWGIPSGE